MTVVAWTVPWLLTCLLATNCVHSASGDYAIRLPSGYLLVRANHIDVVIQAPEPRAEVVIKQTIDRYAVHRAVVVGHVTAPTDTSREYQGLTSGYFILDTATGQRQVGLEKARWLDELRKIGIASEPALRAPSPSDPHYASGSAPATTPATTEAPPPANPAREHRPGALATARTFRSAVADKYSGDDRTPSLAAAGSELVQRLEEGATATAVAAKIAECMAILEQMKSKGQLPPAEYHRLQSMLADIRAVL